MKLTTFQRKIIYIVAIVVLLIPVFMLGQPGTGGNDDSSEIGGGGTLTQIRQHHDISQSSLGNIDPASESMKLATLGLRGFACTILWQKAEYYKKEQYWERLSATLNQIAVLQPHFIRVWEFQAHNLGYNVSVEFDDYRQRYEWIKKGMDYLIRGTKLNRRQPILQWNLGLFCGQKIGTADEKVQYREMFRNDVDYHNSLISEGLDVRTPDALGFDQKPDHWLVGRLWFNKSYDLVDAGAYCRKSPHIFFSDGPKCRLRYSEAIEDEGILDERAKYSWINAGNLWREFGNREVLTTWGHTVQLNGLEAARAVQAQASRDFEDWVADTRSRMESELRASLTSEEKELLAESDAGTLTDSEKIRRSYEIRQRLNPSVMAIAGGVPTARRSRAVELANRLTEAAEYLSHLEAYRQQVNYAYWETRAIAEQNDVTLRARKKVYDADQKLTRADVDGALEDYESAWADWYKVFARWPRMMTDDAGIDVLESIKRYKRVLDRDLPNDFVLKDFIEFKERYDKGGFDMQVDEFLQRWNERAEQLAGVESDFFSDQTAIIPGVWNPLDAQRKSPNVDTTVGSDQNEVPSSDGKPESGGDVSPRSSRPPRLEHPELPDFGSEVP